MINRILPDLKKSISLFIFLWLAVQLIAALSFPSRVEAALSYTMTTSIVGVHPSAINQPEDSWMGRTINKLKIFDGKLYAGYGDYGQNTGPIAINPLNLSNNQFEAAEVAIPSEAVGNWKVINGKLYTTIIDVTGCGNCSIGYAVYSPGTGWEIKKPVKGEHIFDIATLDGSDLWLFGSTNTDSAAAWRSTDDGETWTLMRTHTNEPGISNTERYYWGAKLNGKMYMKSSIGMYQNPYEVFDGTSWGTIENYLDVCSTGNAGKGPNPVVFQNKIICSNGFMKSFDGTSASDLAMPPLYNCGTEMGDYIVNDDYLYILCGDYDSYDEINNTKLLRTKNLTNWDVISGLPERARSIEVDVSTNTIYIGTENAEIYSGTLPPADNIAPNVTITSPNASYEHLMSKPLTLNVTVNDAQSGIDEVVYKLNDTVFATSSTAPYAAIVANSYNQSTKQWKYPAGNYTLTAIATDAAGNTATDSIQITFEEPVLSQNIPASTSGSGTAPVKLSLLTSTASIACASSIAGSELGATDGNKTYPLGLTNFCLDVAPGSSHTVMLKYQTDLVPSDVTARYYNSQTKEFSNIPNAAIAKITEDGINYLRLTYSITDGGPLDEDGVANGEIIDPVGLAVATGINAGGGDGSSGGNNTGGSSQNKSGSSGQHNGSNANLVSSNGQQSSGKLFKTGENTTFVQLLASGVLAVALTSLVMVRKRSAKK